MPDRIAVEQLEARLASLTGRDRTAALIQLSEEITGGDPVRAERLADEATLLASGGLAGEGDSRLEAQALIARSEARYRLGRLEDSRHDAETALALTAGIAEPHLSALALRAAGVARGALGEAASALEALHQGLELARACSPRSRSVARILISLGVAHNSAMRSRERDDCYQEAVELAHELGLGVEEAIALGNLGASLAASGDLPGALEKLLASVEVLRSLDERHLLATTLFNVAYLYLKAGLADDALEVAQDALTISRESGSRLHAGVVEALLADIELDRRQLPRARAFAQEAVAACRELGSPPELAGALGALACVEQREGERDKALALLEEVLVLARHSGLQRIEANALMVVAELRAEQGSEDAALQALRLAESIAGRLREPLIQAGFHACASRVHERLGRLAEALEQVRERERIEADLAREGAAVRIARLRVAHQLERARASADVARQRGAATFEAIVEHTPAVAVSVYDRDGRVKLWNAAARSLYGWPSEEALGRLAVELYLDSVGDREAKQFEELRSACDAEGKIVPLFEAGFQTRAGATGTVQSTLFPIVDAGGERLVVRMDVDLTARKRMELELKQALGDLEELRARLVAENAYLKDELHHGDEFEDLVGRSPEWQRILVLIDQVAPTDATVLLLGETGTGKEIVARAVHARSRRRDAALVKVDCAALPPTLIESELFGHEKGAFTGAQERSLGRFELADRGSIFLDEIGELPLDLQTKLLRVLQDRELERVGSRRTLKVDVRVIAATNRDLAAEVEAGRFRRDLYYRLSAFPIELPPLRARRSDIPLLVEYIIERKRRRLGKRAETVAPEAMQALVGYHWPGNVRELENVIERAIILSRDSNLFLDDFVRIAGAAPRAGAGTMEEAEREHILRTLEASGWRIKGKEGAAERLGLNPSTLRFRMKKLGIDRVP